ncbi:hypothetical protein C4565_08315 [Candidatus Parcubacteria bacterium]|nr:MAG: hypothetical protein C4565_08315 [Candidatus Parcubacteria bacterium]
MRQTASKDPLFWEWLKNRNTANKPTYRDEQPRAEIPTDVSMPASPKVKEPSERGICIIEIF